MRIAIIGSGEVGVLFGACLAGFGREIICINSQFEKGSNLKQATQ